MILTNGDYPKMKMHLVIAALLSSAVLATPVLAQDAANKDATATAVETTTKGAMHKRAPIDQEKFTNIDELKAADKDNDGILSRAELEAYTLDRMVKRATNRLERRLDVNKDGKISLEAIQKKRAERFAELDTNKDGKLDRSELKAAKQGKFGKHGGKHGGKHHGKYDGKHKAKQDDMKSATNDDSSKAN